MKISILVDNAPGTNVLAEFGLSFLIEYADKRVLFDTGQSDLFLTNAKLMNLDVHGVDCIVLSHGHFDHGNGLKHLKGGRLTCHPGCFVKRYREKDRSYIGLKNSKEEIDNKFNLITTDKPYQLFDGAFFLGEIPRVTDFESKVTHFIYQDGTPDFVMDDSAIALKLSKGLFVITGCGHSGIVNTLEYAKKVTGENRIYGVFGGFHLKKNGVQTQKTISYLKDNMVKHIYPSHCTALAALAEFYRAFKVRQIKTGEMFSFD